jgi:hypothetical protein
MNQCVYRYAPLQAIMLHKYGYMVEDWDMPLRPLLVGSSRRAWTDFGWQIVFRTGAALIFP